MHGNPRALSAKALGNCCTNASGSARHQHRFAGKISDLHLRYP
jgi:hypothetical protein